MNSFTYSPEARNPNDESPRVQPPRNASSPAAASLSAIPCRSHSAMRVSHLLQSMPQPTCPRSASRGHLPASQGLQYMQQGPTQQPIMPTVVGSSASPYPQIYESAPHLPPHDGLPDTLSCGKPGIHQLSSARDAQFTQAQLQKRVHRQRRKMPSCDACRERKVKCDASESTSCTECKKHKVRCQFSKETKRRMLSTKQLQDMERQISSLKRELQQVKSFQMRPKPILDAHESIENQPLIKLPGFNHKLSRKPTVSVKQDLSIVRRNLREQGQRIIKVPISHQQTEPAPTVEGEELVLPPKEMADYLITEYYDCIHCFLPIIHWPSFRAQYAQVYRSDTLSGTSKEWAAVFFGVLALGAMHTYQPNREETGKEFLRISCSAIDVWQDTFSLDRARAALLISLFLYEINSKSASWVWIGSAVRVGQEIGLHIGTGPWSTVEAEMRKRVWWCLYGWDRILALELGKSVLIDDQDCEVDLPCPVDDCHITELGTISNGHHKTLLLCTIHVARAIGQLTRTLNFITLSPATLETFDSHLSACLGTFPLHLQPQSDQKIDIRSLDPIIYLQNARLLLHRHNISPNCQNNVRSNAIDSCVDISLDTARILSRCMYPGNSISPYRVVATSPASRFDKRSTGDWRKSFASCAGALFCTHIWRCALFLLFRQEYTAALTCAQVCAAVGSGRAINLACSRHLMFFLRVLLDRLNHADMALLDQDEEMMAYVSGDMQGTAKESWVWQGSETGSQLDLMPDSMPRGSQGPALGLEHNDSHDKIFHWIQSSIQELLGKQRRDQQRVHHGPPLPLEPSTFHPESIASDMLHARSAPAPSRMDIASLI